MKLALDFFPGKIIEQYDLHSIVYPKGWIYMNIRKGIRGLKQAGRIVNDWLKIHLTQFGYAHVPRTPALWKHATSHITFSLVVDDFGVKYVGKKNADHLIQDLKKQHTISMDWTGSFFCGLHIQWDYSALTYNISMPDYLKESLHKFQQPKPPRLQNTPSAWKAPTYGTKIHYADDADHPSLFSPKSIHLVQQIVGTLLYYTIAVDPTMLISLGTLWLLNYADTNPDATIWYTASDIILHVHSNASYLSAPCARSRASGHYFLSNRLPDPKNLPRIRPRLNGPIHTVSKIMSNVMGSAAEAETGATYINGQEAIPIHTLLRELGHPQPATPMQVDNSTAVRFVKDTIKQKRSKAIDMHFYWIHDITGRSQFLVYWQPGITNLSEYHKKKSLACASPPHAVYILAFD